MWSPGEEVGNDSCLGLLFDCVRCLAQKEMSWKGQTPDLQKKALRYRNCSALPVGTQIVQPFWRAVSCCSVKIRTHLLYDPAILFLGTCPKDILSPVPSGLCEDTHSPIIWWWWGVGGSLGHHHQGGVWHSEWKLPMDYCAVVRNRGWVCTYQCGRILRTVLAEELRKREWDL